jgi:hypothetical protein
MSRVQRGAPGCKIQCTRHIIDRISKIVIGCTGAAILEGAGRLF